MLIVDGQVLQGQLYVGYKYTYLYMHVLVTAYESGEVVGMAVGEQEAGAILSNINMWKRTTLKQGSCTWDYGVLRKRKLQDDKSYQQPGKEPTRQQ